MEPMKSAAKIDTLVWAYLEAFKRKDVAALTQFLDPEVRFAGPTARADGRANVLAAFGTVLPILLDIHVRHVFADEPRAVAIYDFECVPPIGSIRMAELLHFSEGRIRSIEMFFDPRAFQAASGA